MSGSNAPGTVYVCVQRIQAAVACVLGLGILLVATATLVYAQDAVPPSVTDTTLDISPITTELIKLVAAAIGAVAVWVGIYIKSWVGNKIDLSQTQLDEMLQAQYNEAVLRGMAYAETVVGEKMPKTIDTGSAFIKSAGDYVMTYWPDLVKKLNLTPEKVRETILSRLPTPSAEKAQELAVAKATATTPPKA